MLGLCMLLTLVEGKLQLGLLTRLTLIRKGLQLNPTTVSRLKRRRLQLRPTIMHSLKRKMLQIGLPTEQIVMPARLKRAHYHANSEEKKEAVRSAYKAQPDKYKAAVRTAYRFEPDKKRAAARAAARAAYIAQPIKKKTAVRAAYRAQPDKKRNAARAAYRAQPDKKRAVVRAAYISQCAKRKTMFKAYHKANHSARLKYFRKYHCCTKIKPVTKAKYRLAQPTLLVIDQCVNTVKANLRANAEAMSQLEEAFKAWHCGVAEQLSRDDLEMTVCRLVAQRLVCKSLQVRKEHAGLLLGSLKSIKSIKLNEESDFGKSCHTRSTEPFSMRQPTNLLLLETPLFPSMREGSVLWLKKSLMSPQRMLLV